MNIHWQPHPKQIEALERTEYEILYGGARGGGKTDAGMVWMLYDIDNPQFRGLVVRRNADDLSDWIDRAKTMYAPTGAQFVGKPATITFPSGAKIKTGHLKDENAFEKYKGHEYHRILIEELTLIPSEMAYIKLISSCRSTVEGLVPQIFSTTNPDGPGFKWVKKRFVDVAESCTPYADPISLRERIYIPATVYDNPEILDKDPEYVNYLRALPEDLRKAWLEGSWDLTEIKGAYYGQQMRDARKARRICKVPYDSAALVHTAWDLGMDDSTSIIFWQKVGQEIRNIDYIECSGEGFPYYAKELKDRSNELGYNYGYHFGPHDLKVRELGSGKSRLQTAADLGITFIAMPRVTRKEDGIEMVRNMLPFCYWDVEKCSQIISCVESYRKVWDETLQIFRNQPLHDWASHGADATQTQAQALAMVRNNSQTKKKRVKPQHC